MIGPAKRACSGHTHFEIPVIDELLDIPIDTLFQYCFADTPVYRRVLDARKTFGKLIYHRLSFLSVLAVSHKLSFAKTTGSIAETFIINIYS